MTLSRTARLVAAAFTVNGVVHLVRPQVFEPAMPAWVPAHREMIVWSGYAELACAAGLVVPQTRRAAALAGAGLLVGKPVSASGHDQAARLGLINLETWAI